MTSGFVHEVLPDFAPISSFVQPFETPVFEALDHDLL